MEPRERCCAFTGHRPGKLPDKGNEKSEKILRCKHFLFMEIHKAYQDGYREFLCGMAMGTDLWCGEIVLALRPLCPQIRLHAVLPWRTQTQYWPPHWKIRHQRVREGADQVTVLQESYTPDCFSKRNRFLVSRASRLIALSDGTSGGSGETVAFAREEGCEIILLSPTDRNLLG